jgi:hypothetical protein
MSYIIRGDFGIDADRVQVDACADAIALGIIDTDSAQCLDDPGGFGPYQNTATANPSATIS